MSTFKWEISEPAQNDAATGVRSGTVELDDVKLADRVSLWRVENQDGSVTLLAQPSGEVELADKEQVRSKISRGVLNVCVIVVTLLLSFMIIHDVMLGQLTFKEILATAATLFVGFDLGIRKKG